MKAIIELDVPDWQIGQEVTVYFPDTMIKHGKCESSKERLGIVHCKDCRWWHESETAEGFGDCGQANGIMLKPSNWFCADGTRRDYVKPVTESATDWNGINCE